MASLTRKDWIELFMLASEAHRIAPRGKRQGREIKWRLSKIMDKCEIVLGQLPRPDRDEAEPIPKETS